MSEPDFKLGRDAKAYIQAELRRMDDQPPAGLSALLAPYTEPLRQIFVTLQQVRQAWIAWVEQNREQLAALQQVFQYAATRAAEFIGAADSAAKSFALTLERLPVLAEQGWTLPMYLSPQDLSHFAQLQDHEEATAFILGKLQASDPDFSAMEQRLLGEPLLADFPKMLPQCFRSIRRNDFAIVVPALMAMLERVVLSFNPPDLKASTDVPRTLKQNGPLARRVQHDLFCSAIFLTLSKVVAKLWEQHSLFAPADPVLSRPAIQHGRVEPPDSLGEIVRLLTTVETALALHDYMNSKEWMEAEHAHTDPKLKIFHAMFAGIFYLRHRNTPD